MKQILLISVILASLLSPCLAQSTKYLSDVEKKQIIKEILSDTDFSQEEPLNSEEGVANLSRKNLPDNFTLTKIKAFRLQLWTPQEVEEKSYSGFTYYAFEKFEIKGSKLIIRFTYSRRNGWAESVSFSITDYVYRNISGKWKRSKKIRYPKIKS